MSQSSCEIVSAIMPQYNDTVIDLLSDDEETDDNNIHDKNFFTHKKFCYNLLRSTENKSTSGKGIIDVDDGNAECVKNFIVNGRGFQFRWVNEDPIVIPDSEDEEDEPGGIAYSEEMEPEINNNNISAEQRRNLSESNDLRFFIRKTQDGFWTVVNTEEKDQFNTGCGTINYDDDVNNDEEEIDENVVTKQEIKRRNLILKYYLPVLKDYLHINDEVPDDKICEYLKKKTGLPVNCIREWFTRKLTGEHAKNKKKYRKKNQIHVRPDKKYQVYNRILTLKRTNK